MALDGASVKLPTKLLRMDPNTRKADLEERRREPSQWWNLSLPRASQTNEALGLLERRPAQPKGRWPK
jgi:hypothetical protein